MNTNIKNITLLIIRIVVGGMIAYSGITKLMNTDMMINAFAGMGLSSTIFWLVAVGELLAGLGVLFGVYTKVAAAGTAIIMAGAVYFTGATMMIPILLLVGSLVLMYTGSGKYALKADAFSKIDSTTTPAAPQAAAQTTPVQSPTSTPTNPTL